MNANWTKDEKKKQKKEKEEEETVVAIYLLWSLPFVVTDETIKRLAGCCRHSPNMFSWLLLLL